MVLVEALFQEGVDGIWLAISQQQDVLNVILGLDILYSAILRGQAVDFGEVRELFLEH
jgi:hypothetical protein